MTKTTLTDGSPVTPDHREIDPKTGMQKGYVVLSDEERAKGFQEPVRQSYRHLTCGGVTTMSRPLAETYARDPFFYSGTFCAICGTHFPVGEDGQFVWEGTDQKVGTRAELTRLRADAAAMDDAVAHYPHPGYGKPYPITTVLRDLASQEGCDGEPYDAMMFAAKTIDDMRAGRQALVRSTLERAARVAKHRHEVWAAGDGFWDADGLPAVECDVTACDNIADAILALRTAPPPVSEYERKVAQMKEDFPNGI